jgi:hypothetical protein
MVLLLLTYNALLPGGWHCNFMQDFILGYNYNDEENFPRVKAELISCPLPNNHSSPRFLDRLLKAPWTRRFKVDLVVSGAKVSVIIVGFVYWNPTIGLCLQYTALDKCKLVSIS